jgi:hypothetical protein
VVNPARVAHLGEGAGQAAGVHGVGVQFGEPGGRGGAVPERVGRAVLLTEVPVELPDVLAPARHLADEALDAVQRRRAGAVRQLGAAHALPGVEEAEVERDGQQAVRHPRVVVEHGVLPPAEVRQPGGDEVLQGLQGLGTGGREAPRAVTADEGRLAGPLPAVQVGADLLVDRVLLGPPGRLDRQCGGAARRRLAVVVVQVPAAAGRLPGAVQQQAPGASDAAVEVLHEQAPPAPLAGPATEVGEVHQEPPRGEQLGLREAFDQAERGP